MSIELSVVIPAYLEEENLRILLPRLKQTLQSLVKSYEILILDTVKPMDHTKQVCEEQGVNYLARTPTNSFGSAVRTGLNTAKGEYILFMDADGSHTPEFIKELYAFHLDYDVVIGSRYTEGGTTENTPLLIWMSRVLNLSYSLVLGLNCRDVSNSFKLYKAETIKGLTLKCDHFDIVEELLFKANRRKKLRIKEVPFTFKKRMFGESKRNLFLFILTYIYTLIKLRFMK